MSVVIKMPRRPKSEAVEILEEMLELSRIVEPSGIILIVDLPTGKNHIGATGQYLRDQARMADALSRLNDYFGRRRHLPG